MLKAPVLEVLDKMFILGKTIVLLVLATGSERRATFEMFAITFSNTPLQTWGTETFVNTGISIWLQRRTSEPAVMYSKSG